MMQDTEKPASVVTENTLLETYLCLPLFSMFCLARKPTSGMN